MPPPNEKFVTADTQAVLAQVGFQVSAPYRLDRRRRVLVRHPQSARPRGLSNSTRPFGATQRYASSMISAISRQVAASDRGSSR